MAGCQLSSRRLALLLKMLSQCLARFLRLLQRIPTIIRKHPRLCFLLGPLFSLYRQLFRASPPSSTHEDGSSSQQRSQTYPIARSVAKAGENGVVLASRIPASLGSISSNVPESPSPTDMPYVVEHNDSHQRSPYLSVRDALPLSDTRRVDQTHDPVHREPSGALLLQPCPPHTSRHPHFLPDTLNTRESIPEDHQATSSTTLDAPADPTDGPLNLALTHPHLRRSRPLLHLHSTPHPTDTSLPPRSPSTTSFRSMRTNKSVMSFHSLASAGRASYHRHQGATPHVRSPSPYNHHSAANSVISLSPRVIAQPGGGLIASPTNDNQPSDPTFPNEFPRFAQMTSTDVRRYQKDCFRAPTVGNYEIPRMQFEYDLYSKKPPSGWEAHKHPEGALFYMHSDTHTFTEVDIHDEDVCADVEYFGNFLWEELRYEVQGMDSECLLKLDEVQLVLEPRRDENGVLCCYYFVNPAGRSLFWLDEWDAPGILSSCRGVDSLPHKGLAIQAQYWGHWDLYPTLCKVTLQLKEEAEDMILHAICDHLTSSLSSSPLNPEELKTLLSLLEGIKTDRQNDQGHGAIVFGRIMKIFYLNYYINFHGEQCARLNFNQSVHGWKYHPSKTMMICAPLFFFSPITSLRHLHTIFVDGIASKEKWNAFVNQLTSHLQDTNLLATVLLSANVGFLAINSVDSGHGVSLRQIASYLSLMASFASIMLGLVFVGHNRTESRNSVFAAAKFLTSLQDERHGLETLAIIYNLPHAFLVWGMVLFFVALSAEWWNPGDLTSWISIGTTTVVIFALVAWCIWTARDRTLHWWFQADPDQPSLSDIQHRDQWERDIGTSYCSWVMKRISDFLSAWIKTLHEHSSEKSGRSMQNMNMHSVCVSVPHGDKPDGDAESLHIHVPDGDAGVHEDSNGASSVRINIRQPTLLSNSTA